jgi:hypothetical protein
MNKICVAVFLCLCVSACSKKDEEMIEVSQLDFAYERLKFVCAYERDSLPVLVKDAEELYRYSIYLEKLKGKKIMTRSPSIIVLLQHLITIKQLLTYNYCLSLAELALLMQLRR